MNFEKWQALGNDYLIVEADSLVRALTPAHVRAICAPHTGVGADGILLLSPPAVDAEAVAQLRIFNPDGSEAELSGNGAREAVMYLRARGWTNDDEFVLRTAAGAVTARITGPSTCTMTLGVVRTHSDDFPSGPDDGRATLDAGGQRWRFQHVQVGNPQCAIAVADEPTLESLPLPEIGPAIEHHELFPHRTNVSWYTELASGRIRARIFERGVGETTASGTGATGAAVAYVLGGGSSPVTVALDGGELEVEVADDLNVTLTGWAVPVYAGRLADVFLEELYETQ